MKDLIPLWLIHKSGEKPSDSENDNNGWIAGLFLIAAFFAGEYSYSFAVAQGWSSGIVYTTATAGTIVGGILGAIVGYFALKLIGIALAIGLVVLIGYGLLSLVQTAFASHTFHSDVPYVVEKVANIYDGDTMTILHNGELQRVRLRGIDTPELSEPKCEREKELARAAKEFTVEQLRRAQTVSLVNIDPNEDRYGRWIATVLVDGVSLNDLIVVEGHGRVWRGRRENWC